MKSPDRLDIFTGETSCNGRSRRLMPSCWGNLRRRPLFDPELNVHLGAEKRARAGEKAFGEVLRRDTVPLVERAIRAILDEQS